MKQIILDFQLPKNEVLNSNSIPSHFIVKGKMVSHLRKLGAELGVGFHPESVQPVVYEKLDWLQQENETKIKRSRLKKRLLSDSSLTENEVNTQLEESFPKPEKPLFNVEPLFNRFIVDFVVFPPSKRRLDPPNLWPTLKGFGDGLTDCCFWEDDSCEFMLKTSFLYGGVSGVKNTWKFKIIVTEVTGLDSFTMFSKKEN